MSRVFALAMILCVHTGMAAAQAQPPGAAPAAAPAPAVAAPAAAAPAAPAASAAPPGAAQAAPPGTPGAAPAAGTEPLPQEQPKGDFLTQCGPQIIMLAVMFGIFYFLLIRPQQKKAKEHQELLRSIKKGDRVITNGGIFGTVTGIDDRVAVLEVSEKVRIKVLRSQIAGKTDSGVEPESR